MTKSKIAAFLLGSLFVVSSAFANEAMLKTFMAKYPNAAALNTCATCHAPMVFGTVNGYGAAVQKAKLDFASIENDDSDGDGVANIAEINAGTNPGSKAADPEVFVFTNPKGPVTFDHGKHITDPGHKILGDCIICHGTGAADANPHFNKAFDDSVSIKDLAHTLCKSCHTANGGPGPMCNNCHGR